MDGTASLINNELATRMAKLFVRYVASRAAITRGPRELRALSQDSIDVYCDMWNSFSSYCVAGEISLEELSVEDLNDFLTYDTPPCLKAGRPKARKQRGPMTLRYMFRMLSFIHKMLAFHAQETGAALNACAQKLLEDPRYKYANSDEFDPQANMLSNADLYGLLQYIAMAARLASRSKAGGASLEWQEMRTCAALALHLGCGLTSRELRKLRLSHVHMEDTAAPEAKKMPWKLHVVAVGTGLAHDVPIPQWAQRALRAWLNVRKTLCPGLDLGSSDSAVDLLERDYVFIGMPIGTQWSKEGHYKACAALLRSLGIAGAEGGVFRLRHTFAIRELRIKKRSPQEVQAWLGLKTSKELNRYQRVVLEEVALAA